MLRGVLLLLLLLLSTCCGCSAFIGQAPSAWPNHGLMAADGGGTSQKKQLVVVVGETTRVYHGCWAPDSLTIEHPTDTRFFDRHGGRGRPRHKIGMPGHFSPPQPKAGRSTYPDRRAFFRRLEGEMAAADSILVMGHGKGKGQAAELLIKNIVHNKPDLKMKIRGLVRVDDTHLSDRQILKLARNFLHGRPDPRKRRIIHGQQLQ